MTMMMVNDDKQVKFLHTIRTNEFPLFSQSLAAFRRVYLMFIVGLLLIHFLSTNTLSIPTLCTTLCPALTNVTTQTKLLAKQPSEMNWDEVKRWIFTLFVVGAFNSLHWDLCIALGSGLRWSIIFWPLPFVQKWPLRFIYYSKVRCSNTLILLFLVLKFCIIKHTLNYIRKYSDDGRMV